MLLFHSGVDDGFNPPYHCTPERLLNALEWLETPVIAAHWGGNKMSCEVIEKLCGTGIYFDTALGYNYLSKETAENIIKKHGADKILFGSDSPWHSPKMERDFINSLDISDTSKAKSCLEYKKREQQSSLFYESCKIRLKKQVCLPVKPAFCKIFSEIT